LIPSQDDQALHLTLILVLFRPLSPLQEHGQTITSKVKKFLAKVPGVKKLLKDA
jgi:hypothetical protein